MEIDEEWKLTLTQQCGSRDLLEVVGIHFAPTVGCIFFFGRRWTTTMDGGEGLEVQEAEGDEASSCSHYERAVECLPEACQQMLLRSPVVPLIKTEQGFQAISQDAWVSLVALGAGDPCGEELFNDNNSNNSNKNSFSPQQQSHEGEEDAVQSDADSFSSSCGASQDSQALCEDQLRAAIEEDEDDGNPLEEEEPPSSDGDAEDVSGLVV